MLTNHGLEVAIDGNRGATVLPEIEYRKMRALESIAETLLKLANPPVMIVPEEINESDLKPGLVQYTAPEPKHFIRRRRAQGEPE